MHNVMGNIRCKNETLSDATQQIGKKHTFIKIAVTLEQVMQF